MLGLNWLDTLSNKTVSSSINSQKSYCEAGTYFSCYMHANPLLQLKHFGFLLKYSAGETASTTTYLIVQNFYGGNIDQSDIQLTICQNFPSIFSNCIANTYCLSNYLSTFFPSNFWMKPNRQYSPIKILHNMVAKWLIHLVSKTTLIHFIDGKCHSYIETEKL